MLLLLGLLACVHPAAAPSVSEPAVPVVPPHGGGVRPIRDALLRGDLDQARVGFRAVRVGLAPVPGASPLRDAALSAAERGADAADEPTAALSLGELGQACGACHAAAGVQLPTWVSPEPQGDGVRPEMARHDRALAMAWSGLVRADRAELDAAAAALRATRLSTMTGPTPEAARAMDEAATAAGDALAAAPAGERGARFGALVSVCASCHAHTPGELRPEPD